MVDGEDVQKDILGVDGVGVDVCERGVMDVAAAHDRAFGAGGRAGGEDDHAGGVIVQVEVGGDDDGVGWEGSGLEEGEDVETG